MPSERQWRRACLDSQLRADRNRMREQERVWKPGVYMLAFLLAIDVVGAIAIAVKAILHVL